MHAQFLRLDHDPSRPRFAILHAAAGRARGLVVYVHPFGEEMNKSRRMAALQSRALSEAGFTVLQPDLLGCGDSAGDSGDADWATWIEDVAQACRWLRNSCTAHGNLPMTLWGLRAGALLACEAAARLGDIQQLLLWQPALAGKAVLAQFLRLQRAGDLLGSRTAGESGPDPRKELTAGHAVEIAGYRIAPGLAQGLEACRLPQSPPAVREVIWLEASMQEEPQLMPASRTLVQAWQTGALRIHAQVVRGPAFWQTVEIEEAPELIAQTLAALSAPATAEVGP